MRIQSISTNDFDSVIQDKINSLQMEKQEALEVEDFDQCKYIKQIIDKLKIVGNQLVSLEHQKREAIENEDYEKAKQLKF